LYIKWNYKKNNEELDKKNKNLNLKIDAEDLKNGRWVIKLLKKHLIENIYVHNGLFEDEDLLDTTLINLKLDPNDWYHLQYIHGYLHTLDYFYMSTDNDKLDILNGTPSGYHAGFTTHRLYELRLRLERKPFLRYCLEKSLCQNCDFFLEKNKVVMSQASLEQKKDQYEDKQEYIKPKFFEQIYNYKHRTTKSELDNTKYKIPLTIPDLYYVYNGNILVDNWIDCQPLGKIFDEEEIYDFMSKNPGVTANDVIQSIERSNGNFKSLPSRKEIRQGEESSKLYPESYYEKKYLKYKFKYLKYKNLFK